MNRPSFSETLRKLVCAVVLLAPAVSPAAEGQSLTQMTEQSAAEWLVGSEWQGTVAGQATEIWIPSPGILVWRGEVMPGIWDCRAAALTRQGKGEAGWRWNRDLPSAGSFQLEESLHEMTFKDQAIGGSGKLTAKARSPLPDTTSEAVKKGMRGLENWLAGKSLLWRDKTYNFEGGGTASCEGAQGRWRVTGHGMVETVLESGSLQTALLVQVSSSLQSARIWTDWGTGTARIKGPGISGMADLDPALQPVFNAPAPKATTLPSMQLGDFERWLVGTEWETDVDGSPADDFKYWDWFQSDYTMTTQNVTGAWGFGYNHKGSGQLLWGTTRNLDNKNKGTIDANLLSGRHEWREGGGHMNLIGRRMPWSMGVPPAADMLDWLKGVTFVVGDTNAICTEPGVLLWTKPGGTDQRFPLKVLGPGIIGATWSGNDTMVFVIRTPEKAEMYWRWGISLVSYQKGDPAAAGMAGSTTPLPKLKELAGTPAVPLKASQASVSALLVSELGGGQMAGQASRLSLTALPQGDDEPASLSFNQEVGPQMQKALREVQRFQAVRQKGWPRGQNLELSFADKFSGKDGPSAAVACALVLEGVLAGRKLDPAFAVTGDMNADGSVQPIGGVAAKLRGATKARCTCIGIPQGNAIGALDLAIIDGAAPFLSMQVFSMETFEDALALGAMDGAARPVLLEFTTATGPLKQNPASLRQPAVLAALRDIVKRQPNHLSATILLMIAEGRLPQRLSPAGSLNAVDVAVQDIVKSTMHDLTTASVLDKNSISKARVALRQIKDKLDPRTVPVASAWIAWSEAADRLSGLTVKQESAVRKALEDINATARAARDAGTKLMQNAEFNEDLKR